MECGTKFFAFNSLFLQIFKIVTFIIIIAIFFQIHKKTHTKALIHRHTYYPYYQPNYCIFLHFLAYCVLHSNLAQRVISYSKLYFFIIHEKRSKVMNMGVRTYKRTCDDHIYFCFCFLREMCRIF